MRARSVIMTLGLPVVSVGESGSDAAIASWMATETNLLEQKWIKKRVSQMVLLTKVIYIYCPCKLSFHWSTSSLKYHLLAKHTADAERRPPPRQRQTTLDSLQKRHMLDTTWC